MGTSLLPLHDVSWLPASSQVPEFEPCSWLHPPHFFHLITTKLFYSPCPGLRQAQAWPGGLARPSGGISLEDYLVDKQACHRRVAALLCSHAHMNSKCPPVMLGFHPNSGPLILALDTNISGSL